MRLTADLNLARSFTANARERNRGYEVRLPDTLCVPAVRQS
jgi:hypothetical protein